MNRFTILAVPFLALAACSATQQQAWDTYAGREEVAFASHGQNWLVIDRADLNSLLISPSVASGMAQGLTFGLAGKPDASLIPGVAQAFVAKRGCRVTGTQTVQDGLYYEATYTC